MKKKVKVTLQQTQGGQFYVAQIVNALYVQAFREDPVYVGSFIKREAAEGICAIADVDVTVKALQK